MFKNYDVSSIFWKNPLVNLFGDNSIAGKLYNI